MAYTSWVWLDWRIVAVVSVLHLIMLEIMSGCPLSHAQFMDDKDKRFYEWWMEKLGVRFTPKLKKRMRIFMQYIAPFVIIGLAVLLQVVIKFTPFIQLPF